MRQCDLPAALGEWAIVTGASAGLGRQLALQLSLHHGFKVIAVARRLQRLQTLRGEITASGGVCEVYSADLSHIREIEGLLHFISRTVPSYESVGLLVNNAAGASLGLFASTSPAKHLTIARIGVEAVLCLTHSILTRMMDQEKGAIVFIGSNAANLPTPLMSTACGTKMFMRGFVSSLRSELQYICESPVQIMLVEPSSILTDGWEQFGLNQHIQSEVDPSAMTCLEAATSVLKAIEEYAAGVAPSLPPLLSLGMMSWLPGLLNRWLPLTYQIPLAANSAVRMIHIMADAAAKTGVQMAGAAGGAGGPHDTDGGDDMMSDASDEQQRQPHDSGSMAGGQEEGEQVMWGQYEIPHLSSWDQSRLGVNAA